MLIGSTFAWFTDSVTSGKNRIAAGNLDVDLVMDKDADGNYVSIANGTGDIFSETGNVATGTVTAAPNGRLDEIVRGTQDETDYFALAVHMKEEAGNKYMKKDVTIDVTVAATQADAESDSFGTDYDSNAAYPATPNRIETGITGTVQNNEALTLENADSGVKATIPAGAVTDNTQVTLSVKTETMTADSVTYDISLKDSNGAAVQVTNGKKVTVDLDIGKNLKNVAVKHNGTPMAESDYTYSASTGILTIQTASFSPFEVTFERIATARIGNTIYADLKEAINAAKAGDTVVVLDNLTVTEPLTVDKEVKIDLNNKEIKTNTITNGHIIQAIGSANLTVSNGKLLVIGGRSTTLYAQGTAKVTVENCNVKGAVIISGGDVTINGGTYTADGFSGQPKIWHKTDTISYMGKFSSKDGCGHMGDSILIMARRGSGYGKTDVTIKNVIFNTELTLKDGSTATAYAIKYVDYNNVSGAARGRLDITGNTYNHKLADGQDPLMFIGIDGTDITVK